MLHTKAEVVKSDGQPDGVIEAVVGSSNAVDRMGEVIDQAGWVLDNYTKNPVILWGHNVREERPPIGKALKVWVAGAQNRTKKLMFTVQFDLLDNFAAEIYRKVKDGFINTVSVGFMPLEREDNTYTKAELLELSFVPVPANPEALVQLRSANLNPMELKDMFPQVKEEPVPDEAKEEEKDETQTEEAQESANQEKDEEKVDEGTQTEEQEEKTETETEESEESEEKEESEEESSEEGEKSEETEEEAESVDQKEEQDAEHVPSEEESTEKTEEDSDKAVDGQENKEVEQKGNAVVAMKKYLKDMKNHISSALSTHGKMADTADTMKDAKSTLKDHVSQMGTQLDKLDQLHGTMMGDMVDISGGKSMDDEMETKGVLPYKDLGKAPESDAWDAGAETKGATPADLKLMCAWFDSSAPDNKGSYKLPHHKGSGGHPAVWRGVAAAMAALLGARGGVDIPAGDRKGVYNHLVKHYKDFGKEAPEFRAVEEQVLKGYEEEIHALVLDREDKHAVRLIKKILDVLKESKKQEEKRNPTQAELKAALQVLDIALSQAMKSSKNGGDK